MRSRHVVRLDGVPAELRNSELRMILRLVSHPEGVYMRDLETIPHLKAYKMRKRLGRLWPRLLVADCRGIWRLVEPVTLTVYPPMLDVIDADMRVLIT